MRRLIVLLVVAVAFVAATALPAGAGLPEVYVEPGELVQVIDGIYITVEPNGTVSIIDGIFVEKYSTGGAPLTIAVANHNIEMTVIPGLVCDPKLC